VNFLSVSPPYWFCDCRSGGGEEPNGKNPRPDSDLFDAAEFGKNLAGLSRQFAASTNRRFVLQKRRQLLIRIAERTGIVAAMRVNNPDCSAARIHG